MRRRTLWTGGAILLLVLMGLNLSKAMRDSRSSSAAFPELSPQHRYQVSSLVTPDTQPCMSFQGRNLRSLRVEVYSTAEVEGTPAPGSWFPIRSLSLLPKWVESRKIWEKTFVVVDEDTLEISAESGMALPFNIPLQSISLPRLDPGYYIVKVQNEAFFPRRAFSPGRKPSFPVSDWGIEGVILSTDVVVTAETERDSSTRVSVVRGRDGRPAENCEITLFASRAEGDSLMRTDPDAYIAWHERRQESGVFAKEEEWRKFELHTNYVGLAKLPLLPVGFHVRYVKVDLKDHFVLAGVRSRPGVSFKRDTSPTYSFLDRPENADSDRASARVFFRYWDRTSKELSLPETDSLRVYFGGVPDHWSSVDPLGSVEWSPPVSDSRGQRAQAHWWRKGIRLASWKALVRSRIARSDLEPASITLLDRSPTTVVHGDSIRIEVRAEYASGDEVEGEVSWRVYYTGPDSTPDLWARKPPPWVRGSLDTGPIHHLRRWGERPEELRNGRATLEFASANPPLKTGTNGTRWSDSSLVAHYEVHAVVEQNGAPALAARLEIPVQGSRPWTSLEPAWQSVAFGTAARVRVSGGWVREGSRSVGLRVVATRLPRPEEQGDTLVEERRLELSADSPTYWSFVPPRPGLYSISTYLTDSPDEEATTTAQLYVPSGQGPAADGFGDWIRVELPATDLSGSGEIRVRLLSRLPDSVVWVDLEGAGARTAQVVRLNGGEAEVSFAVEPGMRPRAIVRARLIHDFRMYHHEQRIDIPDPSLYLDVSVGFERTAYLPGQKSILNVHCEDLLQRTASVPLTIAVYGTDLQSPELDTWPDPRPIFHGVEHASPRPWVPALGYGWMRGFVRETGGWGESLPCQTRGTVDLNPMVEDILVVRRIDPSTLPPDFDAMPVSPRPQIRSAIPAVDGDPPHPVSAEVVFWSTSIQTDIEGNATVEIPLGTGTKRWHAVVLAMDERTRTGLGRASTLTRAR